MIKYFVLLMVLNLIAGIWSLYAYTINHKPAYMFGFDCGVVGVIIALAYAVWGGNVLYVLGLMAWGLAATTSMHQYVCDALKC